MKALAWIDAHEGTVLLALALVVLLTSAWERIAARRRARSREELRLAALLHSAEQQLDRAWAEADKWRAVAQARAER